MKKCPNCQAEFPDEQLFCTDCGTKLDPSEMPVLKLLVVKNNKLSGVFVVILAAILVTFLAFRYVTNRHMMSDTSPSETVYTSTQTDEVIVPISDDGDFQIIFPEDSNVLSAEQRNIFTAAGSCLEEAFPSDMIVQNFFYLFTTEQCTAAFNINIKDYKDILFLQYVNGNWVNLDYIILAGGQIMVDSLVDAPTAILSLS